MMRSRRRKKNYFVILFLLVIGLGVGYALISTNLTINGVGKFSRSSWNVHFEDLTYNPGNVTLSQNDVAASINQTTNTDITFTVTLQRPGDFYEFEVAAVNSGTIDAMVGLVTNNLNNNPISSTNQVPAYARYTATYSDGVEIAPNHLLEAGYSETYKVRLEYRTDIDPEDLPDTVQTLTFNFGVQYVQADSNAIEKPLPSFGGDSWENIIRNVRSGNYSFYHVGDTKTIELGNGFGTHTLRIANTSTPAECGTANFSQTACGFVLEFADIISEETLDEFGNTVYSWQDTILRTNLNDENDSTSIINSIPNVLKNAIVGTTVVSGSTIEDTIYFSTDKLYFLSSREVFGDLSNDAYGQASDYDTAFYNTRQLDYYSSMNMSTRNFGPVVKQFNINNYVSDFRWWLRSAYYYDSDDPNSFMYVSDDQEGWEVSHFGFGCGVSPAFRIA